MSRKKSVLGVLPIEALIALQESERHERIKEIPVRARVKPQSVPQSLPALRMLCELGKQLHLHRAQKRLRSPEPEAELHDLIWCWLFTHRSSPRQRRKRTET